MGKKWCWKRLLLFGSLLTEYFAQSLSINLIILDQWIIIIGTTIKKQKPWIDLHCCVLFWFSWNRFYFWLFIAWLTWCSTLVSVSWCVQSAETNCWIFSSFFLLWTNEWTEHKVLPVPTLFHIMFTYWTLVCWTRSRDPTIRLFPRWLMFLIASKWSCKSCSPQSLLGCSIQPALGRGSMPLALWLGTVRRSLAQQDGPGKGRWRDASRIRATEITIIM